ncbi:MAG TPA: hypothetical protein V6D19_09730 [Stenomitos sp.]
MPLVYDKALNQFIFHPSDVSSIDHDAEHQEVKTSKNRNQSFFRSPLIPNTLQAETKIKHLSIIQKINKTKFYLIATGWIGILLYSLYHPMNFHFLGFILYLGLGLLSLIITIMVESVLDYQAFHKGQNILLADLKARGIFFREIQRTLKRRFPRLGSLLYEKYDYNKIHLAADFKKINFHRKNGRSKSIAHLLSSNLEGRYRWRYRDSKIQDCLERHQVFESKKASKEKWMSLTIFLLSLVAEDGLFLAPLYFIDVNVLTSTIFSLFFGFAHFSRYSVINCLRITFHSFSVILFLLPTCSLPTLIIGHIVWDLIFSIPDFAGIVYEKE